MVFADDHVLSSQRILKHEDCGFYMTCQVNRSRTCRLELEFRNARRGASGFRGQHVIITESVCILKEK
jgi:hypothetical protein